MLQCQLLSCNQCETQKCFSKYVTVNSTRSTTQLYTGSSQQTQASKRQAMRRKPRTLPYIYNQAHKNNTLKNESLAGLLKQSEYVPHVQLAIYLPSSLPQLFPETFPLLCHPNILCEKSETINMYNFMKQYLNLPKLLYTLLQAKAAGSFV